MYLKPVKKKKKRFLASIDKFSLYNTSTLGKTHPMRLYQVLNLRAEFESADIDSCSWPALIWTMPVLLEPFRAFLMEMSDKYNVLLFGTGWARDLWLLSSKSTNIKTVYKRPSGYFDLIYTVCGLHSSRVFFFLSWSILLSHFAADMWSTVSCIFVLNMNFEVFFYSWGY